MTEPQKVEDAARAVAMGLRRLDPGPLAELRRMGDDPAPLFWLLAAQNPAIDRRPEPWVPIARILAILTPKGRAEDRPPVERTRPLGEALCDGGDPGWPGPLKPTEKPRPVLSERRLAQLLATRGPARAVALTRAALMLARGLPDDMQVNPADIAWAMLAPDRTGAIARAYYRRLDKASRISDNEKEQA